MKPWSVYTTKYLVAGSDSPPRVDSLRYVQVGQGEQHLADDAVSFVLVKVFDFKQQRPSEGFSIGHVEDERLVEERVLCLAVDHGLT